MTTSSLSHRWLSRALPLAVACLLAARGAWAQDSLLAIRRDAIVGSIDFRFQDTQSFSSLELGKVLGLKSRGSLYAFRRVLGKLPILNAPATQRFDPIELQKDVVRLRRFYGRSGFLQARVDYRVRVNDSGSLVSVVFLIDEGPSVVLSDIEVVGLDGNQQLGLPDSLGEDWRTLQAELGADVGRRFGEAEARAAESRTLGWLTNRGFPFATAASRRMVDSLRGTVRISLETNPGPRTRLGAITVDGNSSVGDRVVLRELPFRTGDWYSADALALGRKRLQGVDLLAQSLVDVDSSLASDSTLGVRVRVQEARPRLALAELGYVTAGAGVTARGQWTHPNFTGGARSLSASLEGQTGVASSGEQSERLLRASLYLTQPYVFVPRLSLIGGPFAEYRDDFAERSVAIGLNASLIYRLASFSTITLQYQYSARRISEYRFGDVSSADITRPLIADLVDSLGRDEEKSTLALSASVSRVDDLANPSRGWVLRPSVKLTVPGAFSTAQFVRTDLTAIRFQPLSRKLVLAGRVSVGRLFPYGKSIPAPGENPAFEFIRLREESMTAGGTNDVRGWGNRLLGPKVPNAEAKIDGSDTVLVANSYVPIGALAKFSGSLELRFPVPGLPPSWAGHLFLDAGKAWTPDERFSQTLLLPGQTDLRFATGVGISYQTPVGAIRVSMGCKLNPSDLDLRDPGKVLDALVNGLPVSSVAPEWARRLHLHLSLGLAL